MSDSRALFGWSEGGEMLGMHRTGALVLGLHGDVLIELLVAQGCRPLSGITWRVEQTGTGASQKVRSGAVTGGMPRPAAP
jgi:small ligand-binding sensory domain FIST